MTKHRITTPLAPVETFASAVPQVIVSDLEMPGMSGFDMGRNIRAEAENIQPVMLAIAGSADVDIEQRVAEAGFDGFFPEPTDVIRLLAGLLVFWATSWAG